MEQDFFRLVVEGLRRAEHEHAKADWQAKGLKVLANATSYGIYAQMARQETGPKNRVVDITVYGRDDEPHPWKTTTPEDAGRYCFPPLAATIIGAARLLLAMAEALATHRRATYAFYDTDSMFLIATEHGRYVPCPGGPAQTPGG